VKVAMSWAKTSVISAGTGTTDLWIKSVNTLNGTTLSGVSSPCGVTLPAVKTLVSTVLLQFPGSIWDSADMPTYPVNGTQTATMMMTTAQVGLLGLEPKGDAGPSVYQNASTAWPPPNGPNATSDPFPQFMMSQLSDDDGDGHPGITVTPAGDGGYTFPPTSLNFANNQADMIYVVSRQEVALSGTMNGCVNSSGTATVGLFENHAVGCHDAPGKGSQCASPSSATGGGAGYLDDNRTVYTPGSATYQAVEVPAGATCAMVRSAI
jgi:hypothetical protein